MGHQQIFLVSQQTTCPADPTGRAANRDQPWPTESGTPHSMEGTQRSGGKQRDFGYLRLLSLGPEISHKRFPSAPIFKNQIHYLGSHLGWKPSGCQAQVWGGHLGNRPRWPAGQGQGGRGRCRHNQGHENAPRYPEEVFWTWDLAPVGKSSAFLLWNMIVAASKLAEKSTVVHLPLHFKTTLVKYLSFLKEITAYYSLLWHHLALQFHLIMVTSMAISAHKTHSHDIFPPGMVECVLGVPLQSLKL